MLLSYNKFSDFIEKYFGSREDRQVRLVGVNRSYDSGYFDIVRFFDSGKLVPEEVEIKYESGQYKLTDPRIREFAVKIEIHLRQQGRLYDGPKVMRVVATNFTEPPFSLTVQACSYGDFAGSCFALDKPDSLFDDYGGTLREYYIKMAPLAALESHPLALCVGICGILIIETEKRPAHHRMLLVHRSNELASLENSVGPSAAGSIDFTTSSRTLADLAQNSLSQEVREELELADHEFSIEPLAWAREIFRGEKPQLFCLIRTTLPLNELLARLQSSKPDKEFDSFEFVDKSGDLLRTLRQAGANHEAIMNCLLVDEYLGRESC